MVVQGQAEQRESTIWTRRFVGLFAAVALAGCLALSLGVSGINVSALVAVDFTPGNLATLLVYVGLLAVCLAALWTTRDLLQQSGLVLQIASAICAVAGVSLSLRPLVASSPLISLVLVLAVASAVLNLPSLIYLSYGIAGWRSSDRNFVLLQILLTLILGSLILVGLDAFRVISPPEILLIYCRVAAVMVLLARPACWKAQPLITVCLAGGQLAVLLYDAFIFRHLLVMPAVLRFQLLYGLGVGATVLFVLGILLLAQTARVQLTGVAQIEPVAVGQVNVSVASDSATDQ